LKELDSSTTEVTWCGLYDKDEFGNPYIFTVREVDAEGNDWTPDNYTKVENGLNVTNTYVIPYQWQSHRHQDMGQRLSHTS